MTQLISIIIPCYNAVATLPLALASLCAQTYENWECVLVDDGSLDNPEKVIEQIDDPRLCYIRLESNRGRGAARQFAVERASGEYLCMLDADDWIYPDKLQWQVDTLEAEPRIVLVGSGVGVVNHSYELVGIRSCGPEGPVPLIQEPLCRVQMPPVVHAPSMMRMVAVKKIGYDPGFRIAEDADFLLRLLLEHRYAVLPDVTYVYTEQTSVSLAKMLASYHSNRRAVRKYTDRFPFTSRALIGKILLKALVYRLFFALGFGERLVTSRVQAPVQKDRERFAWAWQRVLVQLEHLGFDPPRGHVI